MIDPDADMGRRAWVPCPRCCDNGCVSCTERTACRQQWRYLLAHETRLVFLQCPICRYRWWLDTGFGVGNRRPELCELPDFPAYPGEAA